MGIGLLLIVAMVVVGLRRAHLASAAPWPRLQGVLLAACVWPLLQLALRHLRLGGSSTAVISALGVLALVLSCFVSSPEEAPLRWLRGTRLSEEYPAHARPAAWRWLWQWRRPASDALAPQTLRIGDIPVAPMDETKHFKIIGTTGTGKSTAIHALLSAALARRDRAVIADPDGGYLARFYDAERGDVILNPFLHGSVAWAPFSELREPQDPRELARAWVGSESGESAVWHGYAENFLAAVLERLAGLDEASSAELLRVLASASLEELRALLEGTSAAALVESGNERMFGSVRAITLSRLSALPVLARQPGRPFSVRDFIERGQGVLFMPYRANEIATLRHLISTWLRLAIFQTMAMGEGDQRLWFVVDELDALGAIDGLKDALARLRKFGGRCVLGFQSLAQVSGTYGEAEARTIVENCANTLILRCSASEGGGTARFAAQLVGQREVERLQESMSVGDADGRVRRSFSRSRVLEQALLPAEIEALPDLAGYLKLASMPVWQKVQLSRPLRDAVTEQS